ncbi:DUF2786 domain-containing protein [Acetobacter sp. KSO5]|uniref:DUF2786 domain-containing protein n=1 Tax=Acetobacter sp. KSO5 TaxID=3373674 RepID=UPI00376ED64C
MNDEQKKKLLERLKKLMALSRSANEHEAASALEKAQALMREFSITEDDLDLADYGTTESPAVFIKPRQRLPIYAGMLCSVIESAFGASAVWDTDGREAKVIWIGPQSKTEIAAYSFTVLARLLQKKRSEYKFVALMRESSPGKREARADTYCEGWVMGVRSNIMPYQPSEKEKRLSDLFTRQKFPSLGKADMRGAGLSAGESSDAYSDGISEGRKTRLQAGMKGEKRSQIKETRYLGFGA